MKLEKFAETRWAEFKVGYVIANSSSGVGLQRIPKVASTHFRLAMGLTEWLTTVEAKTSIFRLYSFARNPAERLLSSIPETLLRAKPMGSGFSGDVIVSDEIYDRICSISAATEVDLVADFLEIIREEGFFEPHHFPANWFLFGEDSKPRLNPSMLMIDDLDLLLERLGGEQVKKRRRRNSRSNSAGSWAFEKAKGVAGRSRAALFPRFRRNYPASHPLVALVGGSQNLNSYHVGKSLTSWYSRAKASSEVQQLVQNFAVSHYEDDILLAEAVQVASKSSETEPVPLLDLGLECHNPPPH